MNNIELIISEDMLFYAFRYCLGRMTGAVSECVQYIIFNWNNLKPYTQEMIQNEIRDAITKNWAGRNCDIKEWNKILELKIKENK